jgi:molecular chaperone Hsp33
MNELDSIQTFLFRDAPIRGQIVRLNATFAAALATADYPEVIKRLLGESLCAATLLSSTIKFTGKLSLQAQGDGVLRLLFAQTDEHYHTRGIAHFNPQFNAFENDSNAKDSLTHLSLPELLGNGRLVITLDQQGGERYQGIVNLSGTTLADCLQDYFHQSEQISTFITFMIHDGIASGMIMQRLPTSETEAFNDDQEAMLLWEECVHLASTITEKELALLNNETILHRLFPTYDIQLFDAKPTSFQCSCSREKIVAALHQLGEQEVFQLLEEQDGVIKARCEFCNREYVFDKVDVTGIFKDLISPSSARKQ